MCRTCCRKWTQYDSNYGNKSFYTSYGFKYLLLNVPRRKVWKTENTDVCRFSHSKLAESCLCLQERCALRPVRALKHQKDVVKQIPGLRICFFPPTLRPVISPLWRWRCEDSFQRFLQWIQRYKASPPEGHHAGRSPPRVGSLSDRQTDQNLPPTLETVACGTGSHRG